jgi:hypothetical protein
MNPMRAMAYVAGVAMALAAMLILIDYGLHFL